MDNSAFQSGAAYVFVRNGSNWTQQAYLKASNTGAGDEFGWSVAISGDTIVVGAPFEDSNATGVNGNQNNNVASSGAAYVFVRIGTNWFQQAYLKASNTGGPLPGDSAGDTFGWSVAVSDDTIVVSTDGEDSNATGVNGNQIDNSSMDSGAAYVFIGFGPSPPERTAPAGRLVAWGDNEFGQTNVPSGDDFVAISAAGDAGHALALRSDGSLAGWGLNYGVEVLGSADIFYGQATVPAGTNFKAVAGGTFHSLALRTDGTVVGWGANEVFGHGDFTGQATVPAGLSNVVAIAAGDFHSLALKSDGSLAAWGDNSAGQTNVPAGNDFVAIAAGDFHSVALKADGSIVAWGEDLYGQVRNAPPGTNFVAIASGVKYSLALKSDGSIVGWGAIGAYQTGAEIPPMGTNFVAIAAGYGHSLALKSDGSMVGWGSNYRFDDPSQTFYGQAIPRPGTNFIAIVASSFFSLAIQMEPPALNIAGLGNNVVLSWSTNHIGYTLETKSDVTPFSNWTPVPGTPTILANQFTVTNSVASGNQFFRLKR